MLNPPARAPHSIRTPLLAPYKSFHYWSLSSWEAFKEMLKWCDPGWFRRLPKDLNLSRQHLSAETKPWESSSIHCS